MTTRRSFLKNATLAAGAAIAAPALISKSDAAEPMSVVTPLGFSIDFFDTMNAYSGGHYAKQGLDAKVIGANTGVQMMQLVVSGQGTFGRGAPPDQIRAVAAGQTAPIAVSTISQGCNFRVFSLKSKPVLEPKDFKGKTVGLITMASPTGIYLDVMLAKAGLSASDVERQPTGGTPGAIEILNQGRVDCFISTVAVEVALRRAGAPVEVFNPDKYLPLPGQCYYGMKDTLETRPEMVVSFLKAIRASVEEMLTEPLGPLIKRAAKDFDIPGGSDIDMSEAMLKAAINEMMLSEGKENLMRNLPRLWDGGCAALRCARRISSTSRIRPSFTPINSSTPRSKHDGVNEPFAKRSYHGGMAYERMMSAARRLIEECGTTAFDLAVERARASRAANDIHTARMWVRIALTICDLESGSCAA